VDEQEFLTPKGESYMIKRMNWIAMAILALAITVSAAVPQLLSYQGHAENANGPMVGNYDVTFSLYSASTGGTALWTEGPRALLFDEGVYQSNLGAIESLSGLDFSQSLFLEIEIDGQVMDERVELTSVPYAMYADKAENADYATEAGHATTADNATNADNATEANHAATAGTAVKADTAAYSDTAEVAGHATTADHAGSAETSLHAATADKATYADSAGLAGHAVTADSATYADYAETIPVDINIDSAYFTTGMETDGNVKLTSDEYKKQGVYIRQALPAGGGHSFEMSMEADGQSRISSQGWGTTYGQGYGLVFTPSGLKNLKAYDADIDTLIADSAYINGDMEVADDIQATSNERKNQKIEVRQSYTAGGGRSVGIALTDDGARLSTSTWSPSGYGSGYGLELSPSGLSNVRVKEEASEPTCSAANEGQIIYADDPDVVYVSKTLAVCFRYSNPGGSGYAWKYLTQ